MNLFKVKSILHWFLYDRYDIIKKVYAPDSYPAHNEKFHCQSIQSALAHGSSQICFGTFETTNTALTGSW